MNKIHIDFNELMNSFKTKIIGCLNIYWTFFYQFVNNSLKFINNQFTNQLDNFSEL